MMSKVILVRHGDAVNTAGKFHGMVDNPLTSSGKAEANDIAETLSSSNATRVISSPLSRSRDTASPIAAKLGLQPEVSNSLKPWDLGSFVGKPVDTNLDKVKQYINNPNQPVPNGESFNSFANRHIPFVNSLIYDGKPDTVVLVTHGRNILLTKADIETGNNNNWNKDTMLNNDKSTEHGGYAVADVARGKSKQFEIVTPRSVKAGQS